MARAVRVSVTAAEAELAADALWQAGAAAIEERPGELVVAPALPPLGTDAAGDGAVDGAAAEDEGIRRLLAAVACRWPATVEPVDLAGALDGWRDHARVVAVGRRLLVRPPWLPVPDDVGAGRRDVVIDPGRSFGHGAHPTTRLVLEALERHVHGGERVLDVGCGSGVLAVAALVLGAGAATAVDVDPAARAATAANAARNDVAARLTVLPAADRSASATAPWGREAHDLVVANMLLPDLVSVAPAVRAAVARGGWVVVSGVLDGQRAAVTDAYDAVGLVSAASASDDGWLALTLRVR